jgi:hypothetical protein
MKEQMMNAKMHQLGKCGALMILSAAVLLSACKKEKQADPDLAGNSCTTAKFAIMNTSGAFPNQTSYLQTLPDMGISNLGNGSALEIPTSATIWKFDGTIYSNSFGAPATLIKYRLDDNCKPVEAKRMIVVGANTFSSIEFISATKAYASVGGGLSRLVVFDPSTMQINGEVDLSPIQKKGSPNVFYCGSAVNGNNLFLAAYYSDANYSASYDSCFVAVIDMTTNKVKKLIADARTGMILGNGPIGTVFTKDSNNDIYIQGMGYVYNNKTVPSGLLRIKNGETDFDASYFLNLKAVTGQDCYGIKAINGMALTWRVEDPTDFWCVKGANFKLYKLDLTSATSLGEVSVAIPKSKASQSAPMQLLEDNKLYFGVAGDTENALWTYDLLNGKTEKKFKMTGQCNGIEKIQY